MGANLKFPERQVCFKFREKDMVLNASEMGRTIPLVNTTAFCKSIKSSSCAYMIFVKDVKQDVLEQKNSLLSPRVCFAQKEQGGQMAQCYTICPK